MMMSLLQLGHGMDLPSDVTDDQKTDEDFLRKVHHILLEVEQLSPIFSCSAKFDMILLCILSSFASFQREV